LNVRKLLLAAMAGIPFVHARTAITLPQADREGDTFMKSEPLVAASQRQDLRDTGFVLSVCCPFDQGNPSSCPFHEMRERSREDRLAWFDEISEEASRSIHTYCQLCWKKHIL
jgi:hypothetical protein